MHDGVESKSRSTSRFIHGDVMNRFGRIRLPRVECFCAEPEHLRLFYSLMYTVHMIRSPQERDFNAIDVGVATSGMR
ncbi:hypothetical protein C7S15_7461 [Burkholderia cepacia]|nr:hypothetical protein [Burkholderia cepacia]